MNRYKGMTTRELKWILHGLELAIGKFDCYSVRDLIARELIRAEIKARGKK